MNVIRHHHPVIKQILPAVKMAKGIRNHVRDFRSAQMTFARALVEDWIDRHERPDETVWAPHVLGQRLVQWAAQFRFLTGDHDLIFRSRLLKTWRRMRETIRERDSKVRMTSGFAYMST